MTNEERNSVLEEAARCVENLGEPHYFQFSARMVRELKREELNPSGVDLIAAERKRQIEKEGWDEEHDDLHSLGELACAGACYAAVASAQSRFKVKAETMNPSVHWPWHESWWKPSADKIRNLEKAGALIAAEIDRLKRIKS